jgi:uncharacterized membrane protein SpoIIM required for sporulation
MSPIELKSYEFRREREAGWRELERLLEQVESEGMHSLTATELTRLTALYRSTLSSLSVARSITLDRALLRYLENLSGRAYLVVYGVRRRFGSALLHFIGHSFPVVVRAFRRHIAIAALMMLLGTAAGLALTLSSPDRYYSLVPEAVHQGRTPTSTTEELRDVLFTEDADAGSMLWQFTSFLFTHNAGIGIASFALGFAVGVPVFYLMFINGLMLGAFAGLYQQRDLALEFWGWVLPHGITELTAVVFCGAAGLALAQGLVFPGRHTRLRNLAIRGRQAGILVMGAVVMFLIAALIEGIFRQTVQITWIRYTVAVGTLIAWMVYFARAGRRRGLEDDERGTAQAPNEA